MLDKDKDYLNKYKESLELLELKKKEMEEIRLKLNQEIDDKKLKITQLNIEKHENHLTVNNIYFIIKTNNIIRFWN